MGNGWPLAYRYKPGDFYLGRNDGFLPFDIGVPAQRHALTIAGSRAGKGAAVMIPNLKRWPHNALVIDPKGEAASECWTDRDKATKDEAHGVYVIDPFGSADVPDHVRATINPFDMINLNSDFAREDVRTLADGLIARFGGENPHWDDGTLDVLAGMIALICGQATGEERSLAQLPALFANLPAVLTAMKEVDEDPTGLISTAVGRLSHSEREAGYFLSGVQKSISWISSPPMQRTLSASTFKIDQLRTGSCTVFLVLPPNMLNEHGRFLRLFVSMALRSMAQHSTGRKCLFLLDEFYALGRLDEITKAVGLMPGYGVHLWPFLQDYGQLKSLYGELSDTFFANSDATSFFGNTDQTTLNKILEMMGNRPFVSRKDDEDGLSGKPFLTIQEIRAIVGRSSADVVAKRMLLFATKDDIMSVKLRPYFR